jgi:hypothetical protein
VSPTIEGFALEQPDEVRVGQDEVEVLPDRAGEHDLRGFLAGQGALPAAPHRRPYPLQATLENVSVQLLLRPEEVTRRPPGDPRRRAYVGKAGGLIATLRKEVLGRIEDGLPGADRIALFLLAALHLPSE